MDRDLSEKATIEVPTPVLDNAKYLFQYYLRLLRQASINRQMLEHFDNPSSEDYELHRQTFQYLLGRPHYSSVAASASDVWKCIVLDSNYGFRSAATATTSVDRDFTCIAPMTSLLAVDDDEKRADEKRAQIRHDMLKISIEVVQREFPDVVGLSISKSFSLNLCGYKWKHNNSVPKDIRLNRYSDAPPSFLEIRRRFALAVECYRTRRNNESSGRKECSLSTEDALAWTRKPTPNSLPPAHPPAPEQVMLGPECNFIASVITCTGFPATCLRDWHSVLVLTSCIRSRRAPSLHDPRNTNHRDDVLEITVAAPP